MPDMPAKPMLRSSGISRLVIPAAFNSGTAGHAGVQCLPDVAKELDPGLRRDDDLPGSEHCVPRISSPREDNAIQLLPGCTERTPPDSRQGFSLLFVFFVFFVFQSCFFFHIRAKKLRQRARTP
jgi:hypothetical protein